MCAFPIRLYIEQAFCCYAAGAIFKRIIFESMNSLLEQSLDFSELISHHLSLISQLMQMSFVINIPNVYTQNLAKQVTNTDGGKIIAKKCDVTNEPEVLSVFAWIKENFDHLDVFVNNAGIIKSDLLLGALQTSCIPLFVPSKFNCVDFNVFVFCCCICIYFLSFSTSKRDKRAISKTYST